MPLRSGDFFARAFVYFFLIAILAVPTGNNARAQTLDDHVKALITALEKLSSVEGETSELIDRLRAEINKIKCDTVECKLALFSEFKKSVDGIKRHQS
jgi:hypothetical protein